MGYKFNRNCHVESLEDRLFCVREIQTRASGNEAGSDRFGVFGNQIESAMKPDVHAPATIGIGERIAGAERLFGEWGEKLKKEERIGRLIHRLEADLRRSRKTMRRLGIIDACARCDENTPEGSCCSRGLERKYGPLLLLVNLLLGVDLPQRRQRGDSCYFLGPCGCALRVRHMLCVDYLCPELEKTLGQKSLVEIQTVSGDEIVSAFLLEEAVRETMKQLLQ
ncbi:MAG: hypothetical protein GX422_04295 [Deltaproteobacteria bacterium]|nr:hypothetical protein [Deltaproteobacteria bacterium]